MYPKIIVVTGGILSGIGKGTATASIARLLKNGSKVVPVKCDGYLNVDPGTLNPIEHGEVFVLEDGGEVDMDFGHYERFLNCTCKFEWNLTSGKIFNSIMQKERKGEFLGKTIQIFPHVINEIISWWKRIIDKEKPDILLIEIGGTVGDIENSWFIEAARQLKNKIGHESVMYVHLTYIPFLHSVGELKTKPTQRDVALLREKGIIPDILLCRTEKPLSPKLKEKISLFCDIPIERIITAPDVENIYEIPLAYQKEEILKIIERKFNKTFNPNLENWQRLVRKIKNPKTTTRIAICGKYTALKDSYASIKEALVHAGAHCDTRIECKWVETTDIETGKLSVEKALEGVKGVLVPGGFGPRGAEGKIKVIKYVRENKIPFLGICYGLQLAIVEFARNVCKLENANSTENAQTPHPVIDLMPEQQGITNKGATMRLGAYKAELKPGTLVAKLYNSNFAIERHRHRYEVNPAYHKILQEHGLVFSGMHKNLVEFIELPSHPYFVATQAHNELTSRLEQPNPLFLGFVQAAKAYKSLKS